MHCLDLPSEKIDAYSLCPVKLLAILPRENFKECLLVWKKVKSYMKISGNSFQKSYLSCWVQSVAGSCIQCCKTNWAWSCMCKASDVQKRFCAQTDILITTLFIVDISDPIDRQVTLDTLPVAANSSTFLRTALWKKLKVTG